MGLGKRTVREHKVGDLEWVCVSAYPHSYLYCMDCCYMITMVGEANIAPSRSKLSIAIPWKGKVRDYVYKLSQHAASLCNTPCATPSGQCPKSDGLYLQSEH